MIEGPILIVFSGLPGVGKTTIARALARRLSAVYLRIDTIEQALSDCSLKIKPAEDAGYEVGYAVAEDNLRLGQNVVADSVNAIQLTRDAWRQASHRAGARCVEVEIVCSNPHEHRSRVEKRFDENPDRDMPDWNAVRARHYEPWQRDCLVIDTWQTDIQAAIAAIIARSREGC